MKRYESTKTSDGDGWRHERITLMPDTDAPGYAPIVIEPADADGMRVIAEVVEVLPGTPAEVGV